MEAEDVKPMNYRFCIQLERENYRLFKNLFPENKYIKYVKYTFKQNGI